MITEKDSLKEIKLKELETLQRGQVERTRNTSARAALLRKNHKSRYKRSFKKAKMILKP